MKFIRQFTRICDAVNEWIGSYLVTSAVFFFILLIFANVILRYVFNTSFVFLSELEWHVFAFIFLIGAGFTLLHDGHVRVDIFYSLLNRKKQAWINCIGIIIFLIPSCYLVISKTLPWVMTAYQIGETSVEPNGIPARFVIKAALPMGYFLMLIQGISLFMKSLLIILDKPLNIKGSSQPGE